MIGRGGSGRFLRCGRPWRARQAVGASESWLDLLDGTAHRLRELGVSAPAPFDLDRFRDQLRLLRGREIVLTPLAVRAAAATVCGYCLRLEHWDHVFYTHSRSRLHRTHNAVHEMAHLLLGHRSVGPLPGPAAGPEMAAANGPGWLGLAETGYSTRCEDEADAAAAILLGRWQEPTPSHRTADPAARRGPTRLADAFR